MLQKVLAFSNQSCLMQLNAGLCVCLCGLWCLWEPLSERGISSGTANKQQEVDKDLRKIAFHSDLHKMLE